MRHLVTFDALGVACVPWSTPDIGNVTQGGKRHRFAKKNPKLETWQRYVAQQATAAMSHKGIVSGPVRVSLTFFKKTPPHHRHGELWVTAVEWSEEKDCYVKKGVSSPDICNLFKGTEDALEGVIYANDVQSCVIQSTRLYGPLDGVTVQVDEIEPGDYPGFGEPVGRDRDEQPLGPTAPSVCVRGSTDRAPRKRRSDAGKPRRKDQVSVAVPGAGGDSLPCGAPPE